MRETSYSSGEKTPPDNGLFRAMMIDNLVIDNLVRDGQPGERKFTYCYV
jgi:hypothetical protein